jgi:hypothetical protein
VEALATLRSGDAARAVQHATDALAGAAEAPERGTAAMALLALANLQHGHPPEARRHLADAEQLAARKDPWVLRWSSDRWAEWGIARVLMQEARASLSATGTAAGTNPEH